MRLLSQTSCKGTISDRTDGNTIADGNTIRHDSAEYDKIDTLTVNEILVLIEAIANSRPPDRQEAGED